MATYVLVHGAWHGGWCWKIVAPALRRAGHAVYAPSLTGLGERKHVVTGRSRPDLPMSLWGLTKPEHLAFVGPREVRHPYATMARRNIETIRPGASTS